MPGTTRPPLRNLWTLASLSTDARHDLLEIAARLQRPPDAPAARRPLAGRNIAVICANRGEAPLRLVRDAAGALGASVAHLRRDVVLAGERLRAARLLGRLYDAIDCEGLDAATVREIDSEVRVPVFEGLQDAAEAVAALIKLDQRRGERRDLDDDRLKQCALQAVLLHALAARR